MKSRVGLAIMGLRISAILYYLIIVGCVAGAFLLPSDSEEFSPLVLWLLAGFTLPFVIFIEVVIAHIKRRRFWSWVAGIALGGLYTPSLFLPLGVMILVGLLAEGAKNEFETNRTNFPDRDRDAP
jgi:hypothetical protein